MVADKRERLKGRKSTRGFSMLIHDYFTSAEYAQLSPRAVKALIDVYCQFRGRNNGDLTATWSEMSRRGWTSKDQLGKAISELRKQGWIALTRKGGFESGRRRPNLYAVTWLGIDSCDGKLDVSANPIPSHTWKRSGPLTLVSQTRTTGRFDPPHGVVEIQKSAHRTATRVENA